MIHYSFNFYQRILAAFAVTHIAFVVFFFIIDPIPEERISYLFLPFLVFPVYLGVALFFFVVVSAFNERSQ